MENVKNAIEAKNLESFNRHLADFEKICDKAWFSRLLLHATKAGSIPMMNTLIEKGAGKALGTTEEWYSLFMHSFLGPNALRAIFCPFNWWV